MNHLCFGKKKISDLENRGCFNEYKDNKDGKCMC